MEAKSNNNLFFTCSLIEYIGRDVKRTRKEVAEALGKDRIRRIYEYADILHCEPIEKVYERLIEDAYGTGDIVNGIWDVYRSWIDAHISDYNTDFYYQPRDYIAACYEEGEVLV